MGASSRLFIEIREQEENINQENEKK